MDNTTNQQNPISAYMAVIGKKGGKRRTDAQREAFRRAQAARLASIAKHKQEKGEA